MQDYRYVYRFRTDLSFPALSNGSADSDPGDGDPAAGDSIGTINGFVEWDPGIVDKPDEWQVRLRLRDLTTLWGVVAAPDSATVDVTPRRLQRFDPAGAPTRGTSTRTSDAAVVQSGVVGPTRSGSSRFRGWKVLPDRGRARTGTAVGGRRRRGVRAARQRAAADRPASLPLRSAWALEIEWPGAGDASVEILDVGGAPVRSAFAGRVERGWKATRLDPAGWRRDLFRARAPGRGGGGHALRGAAVMRGPAPRAGAEGGGC
jgi:hypothetical protein